MCFEHDRESEEIAIVFALTEEQSPFLTFIRNTQYTGSITNIRTDTHKGLPIVDMYWHSRLLL